MSSVAAFRAGVIRRLEVVGWWPGTAVIALCALGLRWYVVLRARPTCASNSATVEPGCFQINGDVLYQFTQARLIGDGHFFKNGLEHLITGNLVESAGDPPLYSLLLGTWSALGIDTVAQQRALAGVMGVGTVIVIAMLARHLGGDWAGWLAGVVAALHPLLWINEAMLMSESLYQPTVVAVICVAYAYCTVPCVRRAAAVGAVIGVAALVRAEAALLVVMLLLPLTVLARTIPGRQRVRHLLIGAGSALLVVSPWLIYNNLRFADPVTLTAASGSVLMAGSCDTAWSGPSIGYWANCFTEHGLWDDYEAAFPGITAQSPSERTVYDESVVDSFNRRHALNYIRDNLSRYPQVMLARVGRVLEAYRVGNTLEWAWKLEGRWRAPSTAGLGLYYLLVVPAAIGVWRLRRAGRRLTPLLAWWPVAMGTAALTFGLTRYRVPVDIAMIVLAAVGLTARRCLSPVRSQSGSGPPSSVAGDEDTTVGDRHVVHTHPTPGS